jgi:hypothetical protein
VIERLLETWLNKANERSFQIPFAHCLAYKGYTVLHVSRHCAMEIGKDIIAIAPDGVPCAYQLKGVDGGRMTLGNWRNDLSKQLHPLVHTKIVHPSLKSNRHHRSYIVINGDFDEEVQREIDDFNRASREAGQPERTVDTIVKGQLFQEFQELQSDFWATNLHDLKTYLELFLEDGRGLLPKDKLCNLLNDALPFETENKKKPSKDRCARALAGCAIICAAAISAFTRAENHLAEFEAWTLLWCYTLALTQKWDIRPKYLKFTSDLAADAAYSSLGRLCDELMKRDEFVEGDALIDQPLYRVRFTHLLGLIGLYGLMLHRRFQINHAGAAEKKQLLYAQHFCDKYKDKLYLWGEYAIPQFLSWNLFRKTYDATVATDLVYSGLIQAVCMQNRKGKVDALASPYYDPEMILPHVFGLATQPLDDSFGGQSYFLEGLMHLFARSNMKQEMRGLFPDITRISFRSYRPEEQWQFYLYRNWNRGTEVERFLVPPHNWSELRQQAIECEGADLPSLVKEYPLQYLAMLLVMPYRATASGLRWLSTQMEQQAEDKSWLET